MSNGFVGHKADMVWASIVTLTANDKINAGDALEYDGERQCKPFDGGTFAGFAVADSMRESWDEHDSVSVMQVGTMYVKADDTATENEQVGISSSGDIADAASSTYTTGIVIHGSSRVQALAKQR